MLINVGALTIRIGLGGINYAIIMIRNSQNPILNIKALHYTPSTSWIHFILPGRLTDSPVLGFVGDLLSNLGGAFAFEKYFLLGPIRENIKCPKALPRNLIEGSFPSFALWVFEESCGQLLVALALLHFLLIC